jgi:ribonuclease HI
MKKFFIYTDGGIAPVHGNSIGYGGFGVVVADSDGTTVLASQAGHLASDRVTNQQAELAAAAAGIRLAREISSEPPHVVLSSDSAYVVNCFKEAWWVKWVAGARPWTNSSGKPVENEDLWRDLLSLVSQTCIVLTMRLGPNPWRKLKSEDAAAIKTAYLTGTSVDFQKVRGHSGIALNEAVDRLAGAGKLGSSFTRMGATSHVL